MGVAMPSPEAALVARIVDGLTVSGPTLTGVERHDIARRSRAFKTHKADRSSSAPDTARNTLVWRLTNEAGAIRSSWVAQLEASGISAAEYVEVLGIVARLTAIDTFCFGLGVPFADLPDGDDSMPTGQIDTSASIDGGWVPTVGRAWPPTALSLLPSEHRAMHDLHAVFYLSMEGMADMDADRGLHRTHMELVASRTSLLNECFF